MDILALILVCIALIILVQREHNWHTESTIHVRYNRFREEWEAEVYPYDRSQHGCYSFGRDGVWFQTNQSFHCTGPKNIHPESILGKRISELIEGKSLHQLRRVS